MTSYSFDLGSKPNTENLRESVRHLRHDGHTAYTHRTIWTAIIFFDWLLTLDREVEQFWCRKLTPAALLYYTNRYSAIACNIFVILQLHSWWGQNVEVRQQ